MATTEAHKLDTEVPVVNTVAGATVGVAPREVELNGEQAAALCAFVNQASPATPELREAAAKSRKFRVSVR